jgi:hypothetical protein
MTSLAVRCVRREQGWNNVSGYGLLSDPSDMFYAHDKRKYIDAP